MRRRAVETSLGRKRGKWMIKGRSTYMERRGRGRGGKGGGRRQ
jgi:hypothetical protein